MFEFHLMYIVDPVLFERLGACENDLQVLVCVSIKV